MKTTLSILFLLISFISSSQIMSPLESEILNVLKNYKIKFNKNSVVINKEMSESCRQHSIFMGSTGNLNHVSDFTKVIGKSEIIQQNHNFMRTDKEIAQSVLDVFLNSPSHKKLLEENSKQIGVGVYVDSEGLVWVTVRFL